MYFAVGIKIFFEGEDYGASRRCRRVGDTIGGLVKSRYGMGEAFVLGEAMTSASPLWWVEPDACL